MSSFERTSSPILTMSPQSAHRARPFFQHTSMSLLHAPAWTQSLGQSGFVAPRGRKRSRDEASVNLDSPEKLPPPAEPVKKEDEDEWEYGPGMILIKKSTGYVHDASNQTGTWLDEKSAKEDAKLQEDALVAQRREAQDRPSLRSHKSSRIDLSAAMATQEPRSTHTSPLRHSSSSPSIGNGSQPVIDDFTLHLGIGWRRISGDDDNQAAARGWERYIANHHPVTEPKVLLESTGLSSYLVQAREGFFLFGENLQQGRLVSTDAQRALQNLKASPPVFDGAQTLYAAGTPQPETAVPSMGTTAATADVDVDMN